MRPRKRPLFDMRIACAAMLAEPERVARAGEICPDTADLAKTIDSGERRVFCRGLPRQKLLLTNRNWGRTIKHAGHASFALREASIADKQA